MRRCRPASCWRSCVALVASLAVAWPAAAQDKPRHGRRADLRRALRAAVLRRPPEETFGLIHPIAPHYNTLLRVDPTTRRAPSPSATSPSRGRSPRTS